MPSPYVYECALSPIPTISLIYTTTPRPSAPCGLFRWVHSLIVFRKMKNRPVSPLRTKLNSYQQSNELCSVCVFCSSNSNFNFSFAGTGFEQRCFVGVSCIYFFVLFFVVVVVLQFRIFIFVFIHG